MVYVIQDYLAQLEDLLKQHQLWQNEPIDEHALNFTVPFCHDTLAFEQWLQFVFIKKMSLLIKQQQPLPSNMSIAPMAELMLSKSSGGDEIIELLKEIDNFFGRVND
ncbi:YqcC family protein [Pseudoalteromonas atlantica]|uniref:YqcC family protein n=1 Tax=Pseudoalteromonas atlantica TaxID=288 RepID=UPI0037353035